MCRLSVADMAVISKSTIAVYWILCIQLMLFSKCSVVIHGVRSSKRVPGFSKP